MQAESVGLEPLDTTIATKVLRLAAAVEGVLRCSNNLLERLHHSYFMYLQPNPKTFITIETYVLPASLMLLGLFLLAVSLLMPTRTAAAVTEQTADVSTPDGEKGPKNVYPEKMPQPIRLLTGWPELSQGFCRVVLVHCMCGAAGLVLHWAMAQYSGGEIRSSCVRDRTMFVCTEN